VLLQDVIDFILDLKLTRLQEGDTQLGNILENIIVVKEGAIVSFLHKSS
jgi:hypothetical protein